MGLVHPWRLACPPCVVWVNHIALVLCGPHDANSGRAPAARDVHTLPYHTVLLCTSHVRCMACLNVSPAGPVLV